MLIHCFNTSVTKYSFISLSKYEFNLTQKDKTEFCENIVSVKLLVIVIIDFKRYPSTYCLTQGRCFICSNF